MANVPIGKPAVKSVRTITNTCTRCPSDAVITDFPTPVLQYYKGKPYCPHHYSLEIERDKTDKQRKRQLNDFRDDFRRMINV